MSGLTDQAGGRRTAVNQSVDKAHKTWESSMARQMDRLRDALRERDPRIVAFNCDANFKGDGLELAYWGEPIHIQWPGLDAHSQRERVPCSTFDTTMLLYYLHTADGSPLSDRWIGFRELPDGAFYHQAFQGYSGNQIAAVFGDSPSDLGTAAERLGGWSLPELSPYAYAFTPLPRIRLACSLWPGDEEMRSQASVLFDPASSHYLPTDGLALLGSGLASRLIKQPPS